VAIIYTISVTKADKVIYSHNIVLDPSRSFAHDVHEALETFRRTHASISLLDDDVNLTIQRT
jgi:hypothetical protein